MVSNDEQSQLNESELDFDEQEREIKAENEEAIRSYHQVDFVIDKIGVELQLGKYAFIEFVFFHILLAFKPYSIVFYIKFLHVV